MKGYKAFNENLECNGYQYKIGEVFEHDGLPNVCKVGFHFCKRLVDVFDYYPYVTSGTRVCEVEALGDIATEDNKSATNKIAIGRELSKSEIYELANIGIDCIGVKNTGDKNTGGRNTGHSNTGHRNTGTNNTGDKNTGHRNTGHSNTGTDNTGHSNTGNNNKGRYNTGDFNEGNHNTGSNNCGFNNTGRYNTGDYNTSSYNRGRNNTGSYNLGHSNTGDLNKGTFNTGRDNTGFYNSGNNNVGDGNTGDWNITDYSPGVFCTEEPECLIFDKPSGITLREWRQTEAFSLLRCAPHSPTRWCLEGDMTSEERKEHPGCDTTIGYLKEVPPNQNMQGWWDSLDEEEKNIIKNIPNFDAEKWEKITGIQV